MKSWALTALLMASVSATAVAQQDQPESQPSKIPISSITPAADGTLEFRAGDRVLFKVRLGENGYEMVSNSAQAESVPTPASDNPTPAPNGPNQTPTPAEPAAYQPPPALGVATLHLDVPNRATILIEGDSRYFGTLRATHGTWSRYRHFRIPAPVRGEHEVKVTVRQIGFQCKCNYDIETCPCGTNRTECCKTVTVRAGDDVYLDMRKQPGGPKLPSISFRRNTADVVPADPQAAPMTTDDGAAGEQPESASPETDGSMSDSPADTRPQLPAPPDAERNPFEDDPAD